MTGRVLCLSIGLVLLTACNSGSFSGTSGKQETARKTQPATKPKQPSQPLGNQADATQRPEKTEKPEKIAPVVPAPSPAPMIVPSPATVTPPNAVTAGSFTVWTVPVDPVPGQRYDIYIEVRLPPNIMVYDRNDLSGQVIGTDGYVQRIGRDNMGVLSEEQPFSMQSGKALLVVSVPGALQLVKDTVQVSSDLLHERQEVSLVF